MKFTAERDSLSAAVATAAKGASGRSNPPILNGLLLDVEDNVLTLTGTDLDTTISVVTEVIDTQSGQSIIPARLLGDIVKSALPGRITLDASDDTVEITSAKSTFSLRTLPVADYPKVPEGPEGTASIDATVLSAALSQIVRSASSDNARPLLTGVLFSGNRLVSTDSYRLGIKEIDGLKGLADTDVIVPAKALTEVARLAASKDGDESVSVGINELSATFGRNGTVVTTRLLDGTFPNYAQLIPASYENRAVVNRSEILDALKRMRVLISDNTTPVRWTFGSDVLELSVISQEVGSATESVGCEYSGSDVATAFNCAYIQDAIDAVTDDAIVVELNDASKPAMISGADDGSYKSLVMPVRTS